MAGSTPIMCGPANKENGGCADCSPHGLVAYGAGSSVVIVDVRSMQLVVVLPMPALRGAPLLPAPYVTALRWVPEGLVRDLSLGPAGQLRMAAGDRQGRIALWDVGSIQVTAWLGLDGKLGIQDLCWIYGQHWLLAAIHGPSLIVIWDCNSRTSLWKCDASPEILGCIRCDPFDSRQMCAVGLKGSLVTICVNGLNENEISLKQHQLGSADDRSTQTSTGSEGSVAQTSSSGAPALAAMPGVVARCLFSTTKRGILYVILSREIIVFDLQFGMTLSSVSLPRSCSKLLDYISLVKGEILYCVHVDGKFSAWARKDGTQAFAMCHLDTLMPPLGTTVPAPAILGVCCSSLNLHDDNKPMKTASSIVEDNHCLAPVSCVELPTIRSGENLIYETIFLSISDDGRLWHWQIRTESSNGSHLEATGQHSEVSNAEVQVQSSDYNRTIAKQQPLSTSPEDDISLAIQLELTGQLHLLPSSVITMAVPYPSLQAAIPGGGNAAAAPVGLVVLATQAGTLELLDPVANAITASFAVHHNNVVRGVRWLGNSRLVSFSYLEVKGKGGGFVNKLVVTCVRSGQSKNFRVLQKPERAPMRALRTSPSGRYMLILFREAPAEVWAMTKNPQMLRSLALPFTVMEWALPPAPKPAGSLKVSSQRQSFASKERPTIASTVAAAIAPPGLSTGSGSATTESQQEETAESFAFALVNGSLGVFELRGRRVRDFKPKWPVSSFVSADVLVTAMAYRMPHVVMGDRVGNLRWWDVTTGFSSWFNTHRGGVRRIKFAPVFGRDQTRGRIAVLFNDNTFAIYDLDAQDPLANAIIQPQQAGILVVELDWFPTPSEKVDHLSLCVIGADNSFRVLEVQKSLRETKALYLQSEKTSGWGCLRPMPLYSVALLPLPFALALRMLLQLGIHASWFDINKAKSGAQFQEDLRHYLLSSNLPIIGDAAVAELLLKSLEPYRKTGRLLDSYNVQNYNAICSQRCAYRFAFAALHFGDHAEAVFWLQLPSALALLTEEPDKCDTVFQSSNDSGPTLNHPIDNLLGTESSEVHGAVDSGILELLAEQSSPGELPLGPVDTVPNNRPAVLSAARERIFWHDKLRGTEALQRRVHELVAVGDFEAAVTLLLSTPPDNPNFYIDALRAVSLASAVSPGLHELAVKVIAANMVGTDDSLSGTHLLCAVGRYQEACSQLQDAGRWVDACTLAAAHLQRADYARVLEKWAEHVLNIEHNLWRAMILYVAAGALSEALAALRNAQQPDTAAMFLIACHDEKRASVRSTQSVEEEDDFLKLPGNLKEHQEDVTAVCEYYGQYQRMLAHLCTGVNPVSD